MEQFKSSITWRQRISIGIIGLLFFSLSFGLFKLQVVEHEELQKQSETNRVRLETIIPRRGVVNDRYGDVLIDNRPSYTVSLIAAEIVPGKTLFNLSELIEMDTLEIRKRLNKNLVSRYQPTPIKRDIPFDVVAVLEEQSKQYPGVSYQMERVRKYDTLIGGESFTGYVGEISETELSRITEGDYHLGSIVGKKGLEKEYDLLLRGREGTRYVEVNASGQILGEYSEKAPVPDLPGSNLFLTIDYQLQQDCTQALDTFCCGAIVAMNPKTGGLLAMTSYPGYDANIFSSVIPDSLWSAIREDSTHPLLNRPLNGQYPPGSTVKFVAIGAGLEEGVITENSTFKPCLGGMQYGNRFFRCWEPAGHGSVNAPHALEQSCDVYLYQLGLKLGIDRLSEYYDKCGFGHKTKIDLPSEAKGLNPNTAYYDERYGKRKWTNALVLNNSIGQGELLVTPLQLAQFFCGLANNGVVYRPHIIKQIEHADGSIEQTIPEISYNLPFSPRTMTILLEGLRLVVEGKHGTARSLKNDLYSIGGKTGTAQNPHGENHSWFAAVAPLEDPEIVVVAIVENAGHGSEIAAPLVGKIIRQYIERKMNPENQVTLLEDSE